MIKNDTWIIDKCRTDDLITPYVTESTKKVSVEKNVWTPIISFGLSSYGYDLTLSAKEFFTFRRIPGQLVDPKLFNSNNLEKAPLHESSNGGQYFVLPAHSYGLGVTQERLKIPNNITGLCIGKSTYCRVGVIANTTPLEAGWEGFVTLELSNSAASDVKLWVQEGIVQVLFFEGEPCQTSYADRKGKYNNQDSGVTFARV